MKSVAIQLRAVVTKRGGQLNFVAVVPPKGCPGQRGLQGILFGRDTALCDCERQEQFFVGDLYKRVPGEVISKEPASRSQKPALSVHELLVCQIEFASL